LNDWLISIRRREITKSGQDKMEINPTSESTESRAMLDRAQSVLAKSGISGTVLYYGPSGSSLHGLYQGGVEDSIGIYVVPTNQFLSLTPPPSKIIVDEEKTFQSDTYTRGMMLFEVSYALALLAQGNHRMCELVWAKPTTPSYSTTAWEELVTLSSDKILTSHTLKHYYGIARGSIESVEESTTKKKPNKKIQSPHRALYHAFRCLRCAEAVAQKEIPQIGSEKDQQLLQQLKNEEGDIHEAKTQAKSLVAKLAHDVANAGLPEFDRETVGKWLVRLRKSL